MAANPAVPGNDEISPGVNWRLPSRLIWNGVTSEFCVTKSPEHAGLEPPLFFDVPAHSQSESQLLLRYAKARHAVYSVRML
jgi:hypothetical protein